MLFQSLVSNGGEKLQDSKNNFESCYSQNCKLLIPNSSRPFFAPASNTKPTHMLQVKTPQRPTHGNTKKMQIGCAGIVFLARFQSNPFFF
jgi:hypothetical protein